MNIRYSSLVVILSTLSLWGNAQEKKISFKQGEAVDLLLLTTNPKAQEELNEYFAKAVSIAAKWGYQPQYSVKISQAPTQGNYWPETFILAKWKDYDKREAFTKEIVSEYPQFHERRRAIWTTFNLTFWKVEKDIEITIAPEKTYVATAYWSEENQEFSSFQNRWTKEVAQQGGKVVLELKEGTSPFGYYYNPERFTITEWESTEDFNKFLQKNLRMDHTGVKHVNQFILK